MPSQAACSQGLPSRVTVQGLRGPGCGERAWKGGILPSLQLITPRAAWTNSAVVPRPLVYGRSHLKRRIQVPGGEVIRKLLPCPN